MTELTPAVQDAAYRLGWALRRVFIDEPFDSFWPQIKEQMLNGIFAYTPEAEAERVEAVREAGR